MAGKARLVKKGYIGIDGKARRIKKAYVGVGGVARPCLPSEGEVEYYGTLDSSPFDAYNTGDIVSYKGVLYKSLIDGNTWGP